MLTGVYAKVSDEKKRVGGKSIHLVESSNL